MKKRILFGASPGAFANKGGGEILLMKSRQYVEQLGFETALFDGSQDFSGFDLFHSFSLHRDCFPAVKRAKEAGLKIVISPVYWPCFGSAMRWDRPLEERLRLLAVEMINRLDLFGLSSVRKMLSMADLVTPSSVAEAIMLEKMFMVRPEKISVVHNGVDKRFAKADSKMFEKEYGLKGFVLYAGRIEERKNVLSLIRAVDGTGRLVVIGNPKQGSEAYYKACRKAGKSTIFIPGLDHGSKMLESAYAACRAFALPSWYETPGLAALEAGLAGANVAVTREGCTKEYFSGLASYANPADIQDIREKVLEAMKKAKTPGLKSRIEKNFLWEKTAEETAASYKKALEAEK